MDIKSINNFKTLLSWLSREANWNTGADDFEDIGDIDDITYDFDAEDIHLKPEEFAKIVSLRQLRPLDEKQPWGIFAVEFEGKRFEAASLRKVLSGLVPKRRNRDHAVWEKHNLLFFCFWGEKNNRTFGAAHFEDKPNALPAIKTFYCAPKIADMAELNGFEEKLRKLSWPELPAKPAGADWEAWRGQWAAPFTQTYRQTVKDSETLTRNLAGIALGIRKRILDILAVETENGAIHELCGKFRKALIHDMTSEQFADMYAQTIVYGLFSARCMAGQFDWPEEPDAAGAEFDPKRAIDAIPGTNPFLQNLLKESFTRKDTLSFDELDLGDVTALLRNTDTASILEDFNRQTGGGREDPVIYFYEGFLNAYEKEQKKRRGVYYTPQPVVDFMVRAVDDCLKNEFGIAGGLASTETKRVTAPVKTNGKITGEETQTVPAIQILDPATGTGTFLRQVILQIWANFKKDHAGGTKAETARLWNVYVKKHLLRRLHGFELMMAPYAVAHMKLALVLRDTGYIIEDWAATPDRVNVFLTNSLEEADREGGQGMMFEHDALAAESEAARKTKKNRGINVVIGNPPYSVSSLNKSLWIQELMKSYKEGLNEKNIQPLSDDYIKFIRLGQHYIDSAGNGILAYISNNSFLDGLIHRQMRKSLLDSFCKIYIVNLHGSAKKQETAPDGSKDENVFDIQQGVSINIFVKKSTNDTNEHELAKVYYYDLFGTRDYKYNELTSNGIDTLPFVKIDCAEPNYFFVPKDFSSEDEYAKGFGIDEIFIKQTSGIKTHHDSELVSFDKFKTKTNKVYLYRPFDKRYIDYDMNKVVRPRIEVMHNMDNENIALLTTRQLSTFDFQHSFVTKNMADICSVSTQTKETGYVFPLYLYDSTSSPRASVPPCDKKPNNASAPPCEKNQTSPRRPNLDPKIIAEIEQTLNLKFIPEAPDNNSLCLRASVRDQSHTFSPIDLLDYIYAVLHSPQYRETYKEFLKIDFPRIPYPASRETFWRLAALGSELRQLHLLEGPGFDKIDAENVSGTILVEKIRYDNGSVFVNDDFCFDNVPSEAWDFFIGGYQPAQKWLKDRKGCMLKPEDVRHYRKIILALAETARVMGEIDGMGAV